MDGFTKVNLTIELNDLDVVSFESWLREQVKVYDFKVIPDTSELYESDTTFKKLCSAVKAAQLERDRHWNEKRN